MMSLSASVKHRSSPQPAANPWEVPVPYRNSPCREQLYEDKTGGYLHNKTPVNRSVSPFERRLSSPANQQLSQYNNDDNTAYVNLQMGTQIELQLVGGGAATSAPIDFAGLAQAKAEVQPIWSGNYATSSSSASSGNSPNYRRSPDMNARRLYGACETGGREHRYPLFQDINVEEQLANAAQRLNLEQNSDDDGAIGGGSDVTASGSETVGGPTADDWQLQLILERQGISIREIEELIRVGMNPQTTCTCSRPGSYSCSGCKTNNTQQTQLETEAPPERSVSPLMHPDVTMGVHFECDEMHDSQRYYCQTCTTPYCDECAGETHARHLTIQMVDAVETANYQARSIETEALQAMVQIHDDMNRCRASQDTLDLRMHEMKCEVTTSIKRIVQSLEQREREIMLSIDKAYEQKSAALKARHESLSGSYKRLNKAVDRLSDALGPNNTHRNPFDLVVRKDMAVAEIYAHRQLGWSMPAHEEGWLTFDGSQEQLLQHHINNFGTIGTHNPGLIGDGRGTRAGTSPARQQTARSPAIQNHQLMLSPRGCAIPLSVYPTVVRTGRCGPGQAGLTGPIKMIGNNGDSENNLCRPWGVTCDREGHLVIADRSNNRIQIFKQDGTFVRRFGTHGSGPGQFDRPAGVAVDARRRIIVADKDNHRVQILTMEGQFLLSFGSKGPNNGQFNYPWDVAVNSECQIVVSDTRNHRIQLFSPEGVFLRKYGFETGNNNMWKHFDSPRGVAFNPKGQVIVTDFNNHRVVVVDPDFLKYSFLGGQNENNGNRMFLRPQGVCVDDDGNIIVADSRNHRVQILDAGGNVKWRFGSFGQGPNEMDRPSGICLTPDGRIAVVDFGNNRLLLL